VRNYAPLALLLLAALSMRAQRATSGSLGVSARVAGSMSLTVIPDSGELFSATGSDSVSLVIPVSTSQSFALRVLNANQASTSYVLKARVSGSSQASVCSIDGVTLSTAEERTISGREVYGVDRRHELITDDPATALILRAVRN
jgi:hypothetical protein